MNEFNNEVLTEETPVTYELVNVEETQDHVDETEQGFNYVLIGAAITAVAVGIGFGVKKFKKWRAEKKSELTEEVIVEAPVVEESAEVEETENESK